MLSPPHCVSQPLETRDLNSLERIEAGSKEGAAGRPSKSRGGLMQSRRFFLAVKTRVDDVDGRKKTQTFRANCGHLAAVILSASRRLAPARHEQTSSGCRERTKGKPREESEREEQFARSDSPTNGRLALQKSSLSHARFPNSTPTRSLSSHHPERWERSRSLT